MSRIKMFLNLSDSDTHESKETRSMLTLLLYEYCICILQVPACISHTFIKYTQDYSRTSVLQIVTTLFCLIIMMHMFRLAPKYSYRSRDDLWPQMAFGSKLSTSVRESDKVQLSELIINWLVSIIDKP